MPVLAVDDSETHREAVIDLLSELGYAAHGFENGKELLASDFHREPAVVVLDYKMPVMTGTLVLQEIKKRGLPWKSVMYSGSEDADLVRDCFIYGVSDFVAKGRSTERLLSAIQLAINELEAEQEQMTQDAWAAAQIEDLSAREQLILFKELSGLAPKQICDELDISAANLSTARSRCYKKLGQPLNAIAQYHLYLALAKSIKRVR